MRAQSKYILRHIILCTTKSINFNVGVKPKLKNIQWELPILNYVENGSVVLDMKQADGY
jgi:hypothetical protein